MSSLQAMISPAVIMLFLAGCVSNDVMVKRQTETDVKVEHLLQVAGGLEARMNELAGRVAAIEEKDAQRDLIVSKTDDNPGKSRDTYYTKRTNSRNDKAAVTPVIELINPDSTNKARELGPPPGYVKAFGLYSANNFSDAIQAFETFLKEKSDSDFVPNAYYWIGECYYSSSDLPKALVAFQKVVDSWPHHPKASDAMLKIGYSLTAQKKNDKAKITFEKVIRSYPGSPAAVIAREKLMQNSQSVLK